MTEYICTGIRRTRIILLKFEESSVKAKGRLLVPLNLTEAGLSLFLEMKVQPGC